MIDSIVFVLKQDQFKVKDKSHFTGKQSKLIDGKFTTSLAFSTRATEAKKQGIYFPRITLPERVVRESDGLKKKIKTLEVQVSAPKLLYSTNALDMDYDGYHEFNIRIKKCLEEVGIYTSIEDIRRAPLKRVDFSKVLRLPTYYGTARQVIRSLANFNYKPNSEFAYTKYLDSSEGVAVKFWNHTQGYVIYDKFSEVIGNGYTLFEQEIAQAVLEHKLKKNMIRFELSLQRKQSMEAVLRRFIKTKSKDFTLHDVLVSPEPAKDILLEAFDKVFNPTNTSIFTLAEMQENRLEQYLLEKNLGLKKHALLSYLVNRATKIGELGLWEDLRFRSKGGSFDRYKREVGEILVNLGEIGGNLPHLVGYLRNQHKKFEIFKPSG